MLSQNKLNQNREISILNDFLPQKLSKKQSETIPDYCTLLLKYKYSKKLPDPDKKALEAIFKYSVPHACLFYTWFIK